MRRCSASLMTSTRRVKMAPRSVSHLSDHYLPQVRECTLLINLGNRHFLTLLWGGVGNGTTSLEGIWQHVTI